MKVPEETRNSVNVGMIIKKTTEDKCANWRPSSLRMATAPFTSDSRKKINKRL